MKTAPWIVAPLVLSAALAAQAMPATGTFACGGIGADQREALAESARGANLELELFVAQHGDYVAGADIALVRLGAGSADDAVHMSADGPICYARVASGRYRIEATLNGTTRTAQVTVPAGAGKPVHVSIAFPETAAPGDLDIRPTPEEKQEARTP